jgi:hypothetical protein
MANTEEDTGEFADNDPAPPMYLRTIWGIRRRLDRYAADRGLSRTASATILLDRMLTVEGYPPGHPSPPPNTTPPA